MPLTLAYQPSRAFDDLGEGFADVVEPARFPRHVLRFRNQDWAEHVGLGALSAGEWEKHFARFEPLPGSFPAPLALRYHGHQFRTYNPDLGDGRGFLFAQLKDSVDGRLLDFGTKGSGTTPYSRGGDGRLTLKGSVREALASEMLEALGVNTSKTFSIFETGESLIRHDEPSPTRSGVLVRLSHGHIRIGTFQRLAYFDDAARIEKLLAYCLKQYFPTADRESAAMPPPERAVRFLSEVVRGSADLCASWMMAGFVHGVLNSDNMNISGESFDYGPYRFLPKYDPEFTAAYFDSIGLYSYGRQPETVLWNLEQLARALSLVAPIDTLVEPLKAYVDLFNDAMMTRLLNRLGLKSRGADRDGELLGACFTALSANDILFEQFFHDWYGGEASLERAQQSPDSAKYDGPAFELFLKALKDYRPTADALERLTSERGKAYLARPRPSNLLIDEIESIWAAIDQRDDWSLFENKIAEIRERGRFYGKRSFQSNATV